MKFEVIGDKLKPPLVPLKGSNSWNWQAKPAIKRKFHRYNLVCLTGHLTLENLFCNFVLYVADVIGNSVVRKFVRFGFVSAPGKSLLFSLSIIERKVFVGDSFVICKRRYVERQVRKEYEWVAEDAFIAGRSAILKSFLDRPNIYSTQFFRNEYEAQARRNIARSLAQLSNRS